MTATRKLAFWIGSAAVVLPTWAMAQAAAASVPTELTNAIDKSYPGLESLYKDLHAHPEVGFQETRTAGIMAEQMRKLGFTVTEKVGGTGIVAIYKALGGGWQPSA